MTVDTRHAYETWSGPEISASTEEETALVEEPMTDVIERVNEILGYDIFATTTLAAGYVEFADESLAVAESNLAASAEVLPDE